MDINELRQKYTEKFGKKPFAGWKMEQLLAKMEAPAQEVSSLKAVHKVEVPTQDDRIAKLEALVANLTQENSNLRTETSKLQEGWGEYKPPKEQNKTATIKIYRKDSESPAGVILKAVVFKDNEFDEETRKYNKLVYNVTLRYDNGTEEVVKLSAKELSKIREIEKVEIIKEERRTLRKVQDYVPLPQRDKEGYPKRMLSGGSGYGTSIGQGQIPLEVFMVKSTVVVRRQNGQEFTMENENLNL